MYDTAGSTTPKDSGRTWTIIVVALILSLIVGAVVLWGMVKLSEWQPYTQGEAPLSRAELQQVLMAGAVEGDVAAVELCPGPALYDTAGQVRDAAWLSATYGPVGWTCAEVHPDADYVFRLTELRASCGPAVIIANVKDEDGAPLSGRAVVRYWPGAPALPYYEPPASRWTDLGVVGWTSVNGDVGFGLGAGDYYWPETGSGVTQIYVADYDGPSDLVYNLGMLAATEHCTLFPVWNRIPKEDVVPPTPTPPPPLTPVPPPIEEGEGWVRVEEMWLRLSTPEP